MVNQKTSINFKPLNYEKLLFTAFAVVAFSGVAMANSVEVKESTILKSEIKIVELQEAEATPCENMAIDFYEVLIGDGADNIGLLNNLIAACH